MGKDVVPEGRMLIEAWLSERSEHYRVQTELARRAERLAEAEKDLGEWLCPKDARAAERFCVWYGDSIISASKHNNSFIVDIRTAGKGVVEFNLSRERR